MSTAAIINQLTDEEIDVLKTSKYHDLLKAANREMKKIQTSAD